MNQPTADISRLIELAFEPMQMPNRSALLDERLEPQDEAESLESEIESWRGKSPDPALIRFLHQELRKLSPVATRWLLPHYLQYAITEEAKYSRDEVRFLVLSLVGRDSEVEADIARRLQLLTKSQIEAVIAVFKLLCRDPEWEWDLGEHASLALKTLERLKDRRSDTPRQGADLSGN